jgi:hypothetical protein
MQFKKCGAKRMLIVRPRERFFGPAAALSFGPTFLETLSEGCYSEIIGNALSGTSNRILLCYFSGKPEYAVDITCR